MLQNKKKKAVLYHNMRQAYLEQFEYPKLDLSFRCLFQPNAEGDKIQHCHKNNGITEGRFFMSFATSKVSPINFLIVEMTIFDISEEFVQLSHKFIICVLTCADTFSVDGLTGNQTRATGSVGVTLCPLNYSHSCFICICPT